VASNSQALPFPQATALNVAVAALFAVLAVETPWFSPEVSGEPGTSLSSIEFFFLLVGFAMCALAQAAVEFYRRHRFAVAALFQGEVAHNLALLHRMLPAAVVGQLMLESGEHAAHSFEGVCILFCDIMGFTRLSAESSPEEIIAMLNVMFAGFERAAARNNVFKVQTIGDCFVAVAGIPYVDRDLEHAAGGGGSGGGGSGSSGSAHTRASTPAAEANADVALSPGAAATPAAVAAALSPSSLLLIPFGGRAKARVFPSPDPLAPARPGGAAAGAAARLAIEAAADAAAAEDAALPPLPEPWACMSERAASRLPREQLNAARQLRTALEFVATVRRTRHPRTGQRIEVRIGLHSGAVVGGVIGTRAFRFDVWGQDVLYANKFESGGVGGGVNVSAATRDALLALQASEAFAIPGLRFSRRANGGGDGVVSYLVGVEGFGLNEGLGGEKEA
jgi:class 3 adenylate cyclase